MLYLVATPIGNLQDISFRAIETLKSCDYILCEDTRHSLTLLKHYEIHKPLRSFHKFNEASAEETILSDLKEGKTIGLISDAGTPGISDPGTRLIRLCLENHIKVLAIPGPCAFISALICSGFDTEPFQFVGFLPKQAKALKTSLIGILSYPGTTACYESPERVVKTLDLLRELEPERDVCVARELTKKFEEIKNGSALEQYNYWNANPPRGEIVLLIARNKKEETWDHLTPEEHVKLFESEYKISRQEAIQLVAKTRGVPKRQIYNLMHNPMK